MTIKLSKDHLESAVDVIYESTVEQGKNLNQTANEELMDNIRDLGLNEEHCKICWNRLWEKYKQRLTELGYTLIAK